MIEAEIQRAVFEQLKQLAPPGAVFWHTPNDQHSRRKSGYRAGVSDVMVFHRRELFALELKTDHGHPSEDQLKFISEINRAGGYGCVSHGLDRSLATLRAWGVLKGES